MTTKPKAKKFRVRRSVILNDDKNEERASQAEAAKAVLREEKAQATSKSSPIPVAKLSARQLRMAGRLAERKGLKVENDEEAVRALRAKGIDPFVTNRLEIVERKQPDDMPKPVAIPGSAPSSDANKPVKVASVPAKTNATANLPTTADKAENLRAAQMIKMQRDIARRRRRNYLALFSRLAVFVIMPTVAAWYYFSNIASPLYSTHSDFVIQQAEAQGTGALGGLFSGTSLANSQDSITVQSFLTSREAMLKLEETVGFREHFTAEEMDVLQRMDPDASNETAYKKYTKSVKIGYDPTEGLIRMEVITPDPQLGVEMSNALLGFAELRVDELNRPIRTDQMAGAVQSLADAEENMRAAQARVLNLQEARGVLSADAEVSSLMSQISTFEVQKKEQTLRLQSLLDNAQPNQTKVRVTESEIQRLDDLIADIRSQLTTGSDETASMARIAGELVVAEAELQTRQLMLSQALQQLETARIEANRQVRYLLQGVPPALSDEPSYPRVFENTALTFAILVGIYLMVSLTMSVLREQVSS